MHHLRRLRQRLQGGKSRLFDR
ncbi:hypothetical protein EMIT051CA3_10360 [Pseudomonas chlororaphis]